MRKVAVFLSFLLLGGLAIAIGFYLFVHARPSDSAETVIFEVIPGSSGRAVAERLEAAGLVTNADAFYWYTRLTARGGKIRVGEYAIARNLSPPGVLAVLVSGKSIEYPVTITEGLNRFEIAEILERAGHISADKFRALVVDKAFIRELLGEDLPSLEGYLFPETYKITKYTGAKSLIRMMVQKFKQAYAEAQAQAQVQMTRHEAVIFASIVEKETGAPEERPVISSVFHNRLRKNMRLQTDPTVIYGIWEKTEKMPQNITRRDLAEPNRYNTYTFSGLPYGPISNPGLLALVAALNPATSDYLYFVSRNDGTHVFSKDYQAHNKAVRTFQLDRRAREGKSWRDLQKRK